MDPHGTATLVLQRVYTDCGGSGSWGGSGERRHLLGTDVFVLLAGDDPKTKPQKEFAFCSSHTADGGPKKPQLQMWENCSAFRACEILSGDAGTEGRAEVQCGKEHIVVESDATHTILRGSFGVRELLPHPTKVAPVKSEVRMAMVDC